VNGYKIPLMVRFSVVGQEVPKTCARKYVAKYLQGRRFIIYGIVLPKEHKIQEVITLKMLHIYLLY
jgi:hypothetical protein